MIGIVDVVFNWLGWKWDWSLFVIVCLIFEMIELLEL